MESKPKIFVSSTIYDFADLRSALKYWLNEMGFEVFMSEYPDFKKNSSDNSYDACLRAIEECDYYILLIGARVGGLYSDTPKISITQQEYRTAYQQFENGNIKKIFTFVHKDIWTIKEDRRDLHQYLKEHFLSENELLPDDVKKIESHKSSFINDADFIFSFIDEVRKKNEMSAAVKGNGAFPLNNWINPFSSFEDIANVLRAELRFHSNLSYKQWAELVAQDLAHNLAQLTRKNDGKYLPIYSYASDFREKFPKQQGEMFNIEYTESLGAWMFTMYSMIHIQNLRVELLKGALQSCVFLVYNSEKADYQVSNIQKALSELVSIITRIQRSIEQIGEARFLEKISSLLKIKCRTSVCLYSMNVDCISLVGLYDSQYNIVELSKYLFAVLKTDYDATQYPKLRQTKIFDNDTDGLTFKSTEVSSDEIYRFMLGES